MRIVFVSTDLDYGGAETQLLHLATRLRARGWELKIVSLMSPKAYTKELEIAGIPVVSLGIQRKIPDFRPILKLAQLIRDWQPHIVHSLMVHANLFIRLVRTVAPIQVLVCSARSIDEGGRLREFLYRLTDPLCDITTQVCQAGVERYVWVGAVPRHKIRFIPNGVDTDSFHPDPTTRVRLRHKMELGSTFVWLAAGRFDLPKDYPNMIQAFKRVAGEQRDTQLLIAGDGPLRSAIEELVCSLGLASKVRFLGLRRDMPGLMNAADAYVMSSAWEGMANVLLEASAAGLPIVATDVGGNPEVVLAGKTGFLVPPKNPEALAQTMLRLMNLPEQERQRIGEAARQHIEARFSLDRVADQWEALYHELLDRKGYGRAQ